MMKYCTEVILTQGFWLADTACTQELWTAVMGNNPSYSKGEKRPVENVSWLDCNDFIDQINKTIPDLNLCLPTDAQWEYACRAGTQTPFSFGNDITPEQVNYQGNETVDTKSLPCNDWGLYEMHGNVFEWCADWFGYYNMENTVDPTGPPVGSSRVVRGGNGWLSGPRSVRSAYRLLQRACQP